MAHRPHRIRRGIIALGLLGLVAMTLGILMSTPTPSAIPGQVRVTEIRIAPEIDGRVKAFRVKAGDAVDSGAVLVELDNPELAAAVIAARAAVGEAKAARDRVYAGVRQEQIDIAVQNVAKAKSNLTFAQQEFDRVAALATRDNAARQELDAKEAQLKVSRATLTVAMTEVVAAKAGPTAEERATADAGVALAEASLTVLEQRMDKTILKAPVNGTVGILVAEPGEAVLPGQPALTLEAAGERWFTFNIREDRLPGIAIGSALDLVLEGTGQAIPARVTEIRGLGEFATWRAARAVGDHDLNSFLVRAEPAGETPSLEPGRTVWLKGDVR
jgi:HlyD family secretion protein